MEIQNIEEQKREEVKCMTIFNENQKEWKNFQDNMFGIMIKTNPIAIIKSLPYVNNYYNVLKSGEFESYKRRSDQFEGFPKTSES